MVACVSPNTQEFCHEKGYLSTWLHRLAHRPVSGALHRIGSSDLCRLVAGVPYQIGGTDRYLGAVSGVPYRTAAASSRAGSCGAVSGRWHRPIHRLLAGTPSWESRGRGLGQTSLKRIPVLVTGVRCWDLAPPPKISGRGADMHWVCRNSDTPKVDSCRLS
jgi:hypothetical protein